MPKAANSHELTQYVLRKAIEDVQDTIQCIQDNPQLLAKDLPAWSTALEDLREILANYEK